MVLNYKVYFENNVFKYNCITYNSYLEIGYKDIKKIYGILNRLGVLQKQAGKAGIKKLVCNDFVIIFDFLGSIVIERASNWLNIKNEVPISEGVKLKCSDNSITPPPGQLTDDNKRVSTIKIPANTSDKQKTYKFTVTYTYLTDKKKEQKIELTQDRIEYVVHCGLDTEKYGTTLVAKPESGKDIFEIIYFAEKGTNKERIYDNTVTLEPENYDYLTLISDVPNPEKMYRVRKYQITKNEEVDPRDMEFKAKCGSNESEILYIT